MRGRQSGRQGGGPPPNLGHFRFILTLGLLWEPLERTFSLPGRYQALNSRFDHLQELLLTLSPAPADTHAPMPHMRPISRCIGCGMALVVSGELCCDGER